jgi:Sensory domain in DIguanylate Cyclases and Two-component system
MRGSRQEAPLKDFSIFEYGLKLSPIDQTQDLGQVASISRRDFEERETFICRTTAASVEYLCLLIDNAILLRTNRTGRVYAGFEQLSALQPIIDRYLRIADLSECVYLFGEADWMPPKHPNIRIVELDRAVRLSRETFLIVQSSNLNGALVAFDEESEDDSLPEQIRYWALKTSNANVVRSLATGIEGMIDWSLAA